MNKLKQEQKDLLLKDLCTRLPYGVKISIPDLWTQEREIEILDEIFKGDDGLYRVNSKGQCIEYIKPYLFPFSSMTDEQEKELHSLMIQDSYGILYHTIESFGYIYKNHIDIRGLIPMGLAIDATGLNIY